MKKIERSISIQAAVEKVHDTKTIQQMLKRGEISFRDHESGFKKTLCAACPIHGNNCSVASFERKRGDSTQIIQVLFNCPICGKRFAAEPEKMYLL